MPHSLITGLNTAQNKMMKNIILTTAVLFLSVYFNWRQESSGAVVGPLHVEVLLKAPLHADAGVSTADSISKKTFENKSPQKQRIIKNKKEGTRKKRHAKWVNKASFVNQANLQLHKKNSEAGNHIEKASVQFAFDKSELKDNKAFNKVLHVADQLIFDSTLNISIAGYTDNTGDASYNDILSFNRAQNVKDYLVELGVSESQIHLSFDGVADPVSDNSQEEGRAENRRVEFVLFAAG